MCGGGVGWALQWGWSVVRARRACVFTHDFTEIPKYSGGASNPPPAILKIIAGAVSPNGKMNQKHCLTLQRRRKVSSALLQDTEEHAGHANLNPGPMLLLFSFPCRCAG
ncbi:hypothetical protein BJ741DRAFT_590561 [Chytriomyces cf. hyalinus JEL632]|nr:hypothetical protein BJ741DRAFT_590561 [Chytriomyces cf. hyalinus JEL632]